MVWLTAKSEIWMPTRAKVSELNWLVDNWGRTGYKMHDNMAVRYPTERVLNQWAFSLRQFPDSKVARWWIHLPITKGRWRNFALKMAPGHADLLGKEGRTIGNSLLIRRRGRFFVYFKLDTPVSRVLIPRRRVLAVDLGERTIATSVTWDGSCLRDPRFHARSVRGLRRHYAWLRTRLAERGYLRGLARIGDAERRKVNDWLHKTAKAVVSEALRKEALIAVGNLTGMQRRRARKGRFSRLVHGIPYAKLASFIQYKAKLAGVPVIFVGEEYSSIDCHVCNERGKRPSQGLFSCPACGWEGHADINGAANIAKRAMSYMDIAGALGSEPEGRNPPFADCPTDVEDLPPRFAHSHGRVNRPEALAALS